MGEWVKPTEENIDELFEGVMIRFEEYPGHNRAVPGWKCRKCGWLIGSIGLPCSHQCPDDGRRQT